MQQNEPFKAGVIGWPVTHSLSPALHGYWLKKYNINGVYESLPARPETLRELIKKLKEEEYKGANVTIPHKQNIMALLDEVDEEAKTIGAVNTIVLSNGKWLGANSDVYGFLTHFKQALPEIRPRKALVLGAGGTTRAVTLALKQLGCGHIFIANRTAQKAHLIAQAFEAEVIEWKKKEKVLPHVDVLVNTTSLGMKGQLELEINLSALPAHAIVADIVYNPCATSLLTQARGGGYKTLDGLGMLMHQAAPAFALWFGVRPQVDAVLRQFLVEKL